MSSMPYQKLRWLKNKNPIIIRHINLPNGNKGWLVIDSLGYGKSSGGVRLGGNVNLNEVQLLATDMTSKRAFYNMPFGGAKAGIQCRSTLLPQERRQMFQSFGHAIKDILQERLYIPGTDMGTTPNDIEHLMMGAGCAVDRTESDVDSAYFTAVSVFAAIQAVTSYKGIELDGLRIGIQGLGKVGLHLLRMAEAHGLRLVAVSTKNGGLHDPEGLDVQLIFQLIGAHGDKFVSHYDPERQIGLDAFFAKRMDIMCPCAGIHSINHQNLDKISARFVIPGGNVSVSEEIDQKLFLKDITHIPGYVCNAGGVLGYALKKYGIDRKERNRFLSRGIQNKVTHLLKKSEQNQKTPFRVAQEIVQTKLDIFALESEAELKGKPFLAITRFKNAGVKVILNSALWRLIAINRILPFVNHQLTPKVVYDHLFAISPKC